MQLVYLLSEFLMPLIELMLELLQVRVVFNDGIEFFLVVLRLWVLWKV